MGIVENLPNAIDAMPGLAPGLILGAMAGLGYGFYEDVKADDGLPHRWWQFGGLGAILGGFAWIALSTLS